MSMLQSKLAIFYCGTNGAGKSTLRGFNQDSVQVVIDSDHIAARINPQAPRLADFEAGREAIRLFRFALANQIPFSMESTLSGHSIMQRMHQAKEAGFFVRLNYVAVDKVSLNITRVAERVKTGGHFIDEATIRQRFETSRQNLLQVVPLCDEVFVYDNSAAQPQLIFCLQAQQLFGLTTHWPLWCETLRQDLLEMGYQAVD
ncbi:putative ABC-type ATPase [Neisseria sp. HSC-16F19]|nr:putative ABC-type ATPase [Neisseria sp. HSC-16F19]